MRRLTIRKLDKPIIGILLGDASGIGPEIVAKATAKGILSAHCYPLIIGDQRVLGQGMAVSGVHFEYHAIDDIKDMKWDKGIPVLDQKNQDPAEIIIGKVNPYCGKAVGEMVEIAIGLYQAGKIDGICYAPFNKAAMRTGGYDYESEHDLFVHCFHWTGFSGELNVVNQLWTSRVTSHIPINQVSSHLSAKGIVAAIQLLNQTIKRSGKSHPRIALAALNPHGGENGLCGREEIEMILPAAEEARQLGIGVRGVYPADTIFIKAFKGEYDGVVTMFHDQGQIALKLMEFDQAVTVAGGLPAPITTPAHGTAFDIAGKGLARISSFEAALELVCKMADHDKGLVS